MKAQIVSFNCVLKNKLGQVLSSSFNRDVINQLEEDARDVGNPRLRALVEGIQDVRAGERRRVAVSAEEAYGPYDPALVLHLSRSEIQISERLAVGSKLAIQSDHHDPEQIYRV